jgi:hypothetical protein
MKGAAVIFLTLTFVLYLGGMQLMYWVKMDSAKHKAAEFVQNHSTKTSETKDFVFTSSEYNALQWLEKNKEFVIAGQRYDIETISYSSEGVKITCYSDNEETEIANEFQAFSERLLSTHPQSNSSDNDILSKITKEYLPINLVFLQPGVEKRTSLMVVENIPLSASPISDIWHPPAVC